MDTKALVPSDGRTDIRTRDARGLMPAQVKYLSELAEAIDPRVAARKAGVSLRRVRDWLSKDTAFQTAHEEQVAGAMVAFKQESQVWADAAQDEAWELLTAMKPIKVVIDCEFEPGKKHTTFVEVRDTMARIRLIELAMKLAGRLKDVRQLKVEGEVTHLTAEQKIALMALRLGKKISEQMLEELRNMGVLPAELDPEQAIEGEFRERTE